MHLKPSKHNPVCSSTQFAVHAGCRVFRPPVFTCGLLCPVYCPAGAEQALALHLLNARPSHLPIHCPPYQTKLPTTLPSTLSTNLSTTLNNWTTCMQPNIWQTLGQPPCIHLAIYITKHLAIFQPYQPTYQTCCHPPYQPVSSVTECIVLL